MDQDEYRRMADAGDRHWWYRATRLLLQQTVEPHLHPVDASTRYLDAAGGTGATGRWLAERAPTLLDDFEPFALQSATGSGGYVPVRADLNHLPHPDASFDAVMCITALYHRMNPDPQAIVTDFARVTKPGGVVCLMEPGVRRLWRPHDAITHTSRRFSRSDLARLIPDAGLEPVRATGAYTFLVPIAALLAVLRVGQESSDVDQHESGLGGLLGWLARIERAALRHVDVPFGLSVIALGRKPG